MKEYSSDMITPVIGDSDGWWTNTVEYFGVDYQGIELFCARFLHNKPNQMPVEVKGIVIFITGWSETFLKYAELLRSVYERGFDVYTYDHQSQGLSGRWLPESQFTWLHNFADYSDDFVNIVMLIKENNPTDLPIYCMAHSMGGLVASMAFAQHPELIKKAAFSSPMLRSKCGMKCFNYQYPVSQPLARWIARTSCNFGLGKLNAFGFFKERPQDPITAKLSTDINMMRNYSDLRKSIPRILSCCVTNDWVLQSLNAQRRFAKHYREVKTPILIFQASDDVFVYNQAYDIFAEDAPFVK